jgi:hypothetical protein
MKFVHRDEESGELIVQTLTPEQKEMLGGFYDLPEDEGEPSG